MRAGLIIVHAVPGVIGVLVGFRSLSPPRPADGRRRWRQVYALCVATLIAGLVGLVAYDWSDLDTFARITFTALVALAAFMGFRLWRARREASEQRAGWQERYIDHAYFTYVTLWIGFLIIPALNLPLPQVSVPLVAAAVLMTGHVLITRYKDRLAMPGAGR